jgi:hypothetical protein
VQKGAAAQRPTEEMGKASGFYVQMKDAMGVLDEMEPSITPAELYQIQTLPQDGVFGYLNRNDVSENAKRYLRAFEQYTEARLRSVSGAAISDKEYERDRRTYAKQYGETPKLSADRLRARGGALDALRRRAGSALDDADLGGGGGGAGTVLGTGAFSVAANGKTYRFETQAKLDEFKRKAGLP